MKKLILVIALAVFSFSANAQFNAGINVGIPAADASNGYSFSFGVDANYMLSDDDSFNYGLAAGYQNYTGKTVAGIKISSASFLPLAAIGRYNASEDFVLGADLGYAVGLSPSGNDGGFYFRPMVGYNLGENTQLNASYSSVSVNGGTFANFGVGIMFAL